MPTPASASAPSSPAGPGRTTTPSAATSSDTASPGLNCAPSAALLTDRYELTMVEAGLRSGAAHRRSVFEVFARRLPDGRRYGVVAGTGRLLEALDRFHFTPAELDALERDRVVGPDTLNWLADYRFRGDIWGYGEGECYLPGSPILIVEASFAEAVLLETLILSVLNHDSAIAAAASRMTAHATGRPCLEMGSRRTHEESAVAAARAAYIAGFTATSNLEAGRRYGIPTIGTAAHAFTLVHDDERAAFTAQVDVLGPGTTLLVDTYDVETGVRTAVDVAGTGLGAVRLDSGDLLEQAHTVRTQLDALGATGTKIVVTSDLDEYAVAALAAAPVDSYGVGTSLVTGSGAATAGLVYKLVARQTPDGRLTGVAKRSRDKTSVGGRKYAHRSRGRNGIAEAELITIGTPPPPSATERDLLRPLVRGGEVIGAEPVTAARDRHAASLAELPATARQLSHGEPAVPTRLRSAPLTG
ncbi:MAG: nicotinate phosphoribosyltransferase [Kineosporiaceae bacterium]